MNVDLGIRLFRLDCSQDLEEKERKKKKKKKKKKIHKSDPDPGNLLRNQNSHWI